MRFVKKVLAAALAVMVTVTSLNVRPVEAKVEKVNLSTTMMSELVYGSKRIDRMNAKLTEKKMDVYFYEDTLKDELTLGFVEGMEDVPYISVEDAAEVTEFIYQILGDSKAKFTYSKVDGICTITRENGQTASFNAEANKIIFMDVNDFFKKTKSVSISDLVSPRFNEKGKPVYVKGEKSFSRYGAALQFVLDDYAIDLVEKDGKTYLPLQTFSDIFLAPSNLYVLYNGESVIFAYSDLIQNAGGLTKLGKIYYSVKPKNRSEALAAFTYNELCLNLDYNYGLKDIHGIDSFNQYFLETGLCEELLDTNPKVFAKGMKKLIDVYISDGHTTTGLNSPYLGADAVVDIGTTGRFNDTIADNADLFVNAAKKVYPKGIPQYQEVGDTAYVSFMQFLTPDSVGLNYYGKDKPSKDAPDTIGLMAYAHKQITRKNSPIKNVVLDLSINTGGELNAAAYVVSWFLGECVIDVKDTVSGAESASVYKADLNFDGKFNQQDTLAGRGLNLYCLESPISFSCGNLLPNIFKHSARVTLLGMTSGGGASVVQPLSAADGTSFQVSAKLRMSIVKNGSSYGIDQGAEPDVSITKASTFYNRKKLNKIIHNQ